jgi:putative endonuclease
MNPDERRNRRLFGMAGETAAEDTLRERGLIVEARGFRARAGEIDIVALDGPVVVFVEVKARAGEAFGRPAEAVTPTKRARLIRAASLYLLRRGWSERPCRFDVVEVVGEGPARRVTHIPDAFRPGD